MLQHLQHLLRLGRIDTYNSLHLPIVIVWNGIHYQGYLTLDTQESQRYPGYVLALFKEPANAQPSQPPV